MSIAGNLVGTYSSIGKTLILVDENGNEIPGVIVDSQVIFTAVDSDVKKGKVYASNDGVSVGTLEIE